MAGDQEPTQAVICKTEITNDTSDGHGDNTNIIKPEDMRKCTLCTKTFAGFQAVMRHELMAHNVLTKNKKINKRLNTFLGAINNEERQTRRQQLYAALESSPRGKESDVVLRLYGISSDNVAIIFDRVKHSLSKAFNQLEHKVCMHVYGSFVSGLALKDCDIDLYVEPLDGYRDNERQQRLIFNKISKIFQYRGSDFQKVMPIRRARVPIIKCEHTATGFSLDINTSCPASVYNTYFLRDLVQFDERLQHFLLLLKIWAKELQIISVSMMTSYCFATLALFYLQQPLWQRTRSQATTAFAAKRRKGNNNQAQQQQAAVVNAQPLQPLVPSLKQLQQGAQKQIVGGVNYGYDLQSHMQVLPRQLTIHELVTGFFAFFEYFDFEQEIISPYRGTSLSLEAFRKEQFPFPEYKTQLRMMASSQAMDGKLDTTEPVPELDTGGVICIQDPFCLNHNLARRLGGVGFAYFRQCIRHAAKLCRQSQFADNPAALYQVLLIKMPDDITIAMPDTMKRGNIASHANVPKEPSSTPNKAAPTPTARAGANDSPNQLACTVSMSKSEYRALVVHSVANSGGGDLRQVWVQQYLAGIRTILTDIYQFEVKTINPGSAAEVLNGTPSSQVWLLHGTLDTWTSRQHSRSGDQTFMNCQVEQTLRLVSSRRNDAAFKVNLNAVITLNIELKHTSIELVIAPQHPTVNGAFTINKNHPLRRFFATFKATLQNFSLREVLEAQRLSKSRSQLLGTINAVARFGETM